jgi:hypothetical protein
LRRTRAKALSRITERVLRAGPSLDDPMTPRLLLTIEKLCDGNKVIGSIGCNLPNRRRANSTQCSSPCDRLLVELTRSAEVGQ